MSSLTGNPTFRQDSYLAQFLLFDEPEHLVEEDSGRVADVLLSVLGMRERTLALRPGLPRKSDVACLMAQDLGGEASFDEEHDAEIVAVEEIPVAIVLRPELANATARIALQCLRVHLRVAHVARQDLRVEVAHRLPILEERHLGGGSLAVDVDVAGGNETRHASGDLAETLGEAFAAVADHGLNLLRTHRTSLSHARNAWIPT